MTRPILEVRYSAARAVASIAAPVTIVCLMALFAFVDYDGFLYRAHRRPIALPLMTIGLVWWCVLFWPFAFKLLRLSGSDTTVSLDIDKVTTLDGVIYKKDIRSVNVVKGVGGVNRVKIVTGRSVFYIDVLFQRAADAAGAAAIQAAILRTCAAA